MKDRKNIIISHIENKVNIITLVYTAMLGFTSLKTDVYFKKINSLALMGYLIVIASLSF